MKDSVKIPEKRIKELRKHLRKVEELTNTKILIKDDEIEIEGEDSLNVFKTKTILKAFGRGFDIETSLNLLDDDYRFELIDIREYAGKSENRQKELKGRVIGKKGRIKSLIDEVTETKISVYGKTIGIIGKWDRVQIAREAIELLLQGKMFETLYRFLEKKRI